MSAKRKPQQNNVTNQNPKNPFRPSSAQTGKSARSANWKSNLRKNRIGSLENLNFTQYYSDDSKSLDSNNSKGGFDKEESEDVFKCQGSTDNVSISKNFSESQEICVVPKTKHKKEPLPMKLRAFPQSFWQQPNKTPTVSPASVYCVPSPLSKEDDSSENGETLEEPQQPERQEIVSKPNIDLLFSLFRTVEDEQRKSSGQKIVPLVKRGRPKKSKTELSKVIRDDDPYLSSSVTESFLPLLPKRGSHFDHFQSKFYKDQQILATVSIDGASSNFLSTNHNYSQILSELVVQL